VGLLFQQHKRTVLYPSGFFYHVTELRLCVEQQWQKALLGKNVKRFFLG